MKKSVLIGIIVVSLCIGFVLGMSVGLNRSNGTTPDNTTTTTTTKKITTTTQKKPITVIMPSLPREIRYYSSYTNNTYVKVNITNVTYEVDSYGYISLKFTGEKIYDHEGNNSLNRGYVGYKIYDSAGYVIATGWYMTDDLKVGEKFRDDKTMVTGMKAIPGETYRVELYDYSF